MEVSKDFENKKMVIKREFKAPVEKVWKAWTTPDLLDRWWAPKPWKSETKEMNFNEGGSRLYCMVGPENERHWGKTNYKKIEDQKFFEGEDYFTDETGNKNSDLPVMFFKNFFSESKDGTLIEIETTFPSEEDMKKILEMGMAEGFSLAMDNLDEVLKKN